MNFLKRIFGIKEKLNDIDNEEPNDINDEKQEVIFFRRYQNGAWGKRDEGSFVTSTGNIYDFNFKEIYVSDIEKEFINIMKNNKPTRTCDEYDILRANDMLQDFDENSELLIGGSAYDAGQDTLFGYYHNTLIPLATVGNVRGIIDHDEINYILNILEDINLYHWETFGPQLSLNDFKKRNLNKYKISDPELISRFNRPK